MYYTINDNKYIQRINIVNYMLSLPMPTVKHHEFPQSPNYRPTLESDIIQGVERLIVYTPLRVNAFLPHSNILNTIIKLFLNTLHYQ
jgi:hypothetical protein